MSTSKPLTIESLTWQEKIRLICWDDAYENYPELVEKLKDLGVLENCGSEEVAEFTLAGAAFRDEVYLFVSAQEQAEIR